MSFTLCAMSDDHAALPAPRRRAWPWLAVAILVIAGATIAYGRWGYQAAPAAALAQAIPERLAQATTLLPAVPADQQVMQWAGTEKDPHPCLYVTRDDVARIKQTRKDLLGLTQGGWSLEADGMDKLVAAALIADNDAAQKTVIVEALKQTDELIKQIPKTTNNDVGPHAYGRVFGRAVGLADAALASKLITPDDRAALLAKIAQVGYLINDPKYFNPKAPHGSLCPNMFTSAAAYRLTIAALIPSHPMAKAWFAGALQELKQELDDWTDLNGGMAETPHYSMVILDQWLGAFVIARNAGAARDGHLFDPQLKQAIVWFGNISTPRDPKIGSRRWPTVGHTYVNERSCTFGLMAHLWQEKDPEFAAQMRWMHLEHGAFTEPGVLSYYPAFMGYRWAFDSSNVQPKAPTWTSACYPETGVQLRNVIGSPRETTLYLIAGRNHSHYFNDSGSITLWGKGRELCDEDSYQFRRGTDSRAVHSIVDKPATFNEERVMALREFSTTKDLDYVRGARRGWQRQIAFVKDADPLGPNYFVIADTLDAKSVPTTWRLFLSAAQIAPNGATVTVTGKEDVDLDIIFVQPDTVKPVALADHLEVPVGAAGTLTAVLYPRLKTEQPPKVTPLADGKGVKVVTPAGTDYVFLSPAPFTYKQGDVAFDGKAGVIKVRDGKQIKSIPGPCDVTTEWEGGDRELRAIRWDGPQYPVFPDE